MVARFNLFVLLSQLYRSLRITLQVDTVELIDIAQTKHFARYFPHRYIGVEWKLLRYGSFFKAILLNDFKHCGKVKDAKLRYGTNFENPNIKMLKRFLLILSIALPLTGLAQNNPPKVLRIFEENLTINNNVAYYKNQLFTGISITFWGPSKKNPTAPKSKFQETSWVNGQKDGVYKEYAPEGYLLATETWSEGAKYGYYEYHYPNGAIESKGNFENNMLNGVIEGFYQSGVKKYAKTYMRNVAHGPCTLWFNNGSVEQEINYINGLPDGRVRAYYIDSSLRYEKHFKMGVPNGLSYEFHRTGCPAEEAYYINGKLDSVYRAWNEVNCKLLKEGYYKDGQKHGVFVEYDKVGDTLTVLEYAYNKPSGVYRAYYKEKVWDKIQLEADGLYSAGEKEGFWRTGLATNYQHSEGNYEHNTMVGKWLHYDKYGYLLITQTFDDNGDLIKQKFHKKRKKK